MRPLRIVLIATLLAVPTVSQAGGAFLFKGGVLRINDDSQVVGPSLRDVDQDSYSTLALNIEARKKNGVAFGAELITFRNDFTPPVAPQQGVVRTHVLQFVAKKYFNPGGVFYPYLGAGVGASHIDADYSSAGGSYQNDEFVLALQAVLGFELRFDNLSFVLEAKHLYFDVGRNEFDPTGTGVFAGFGFNW